jgi:hypothetical protein
MLIFKSQIGSFHHQLHRDLRFKRRLAPALFCRGHGHPSPVEIIRKLAEVGRQTTGCDDETDGFPSCDGKSSIELAASRLSICRVCHSAYPRGCAARHSTHAVGS